MMSEITRDFLPEEKDPKFPSEGNEMPLKNLDRKIRDVVEFSSDAIYDEIKRSEYAGGRWGDLKEAGFGWPKHEVHHMPAASTSELPREDGPAIVMDYADHRQTASCGNSREAVEYRKKQSDLIAQGKFMEAFQMDVDDIHEKFGTKYDEAIYEAREYVKTIVKKLEGEKHE